jgi:hypothetical protein
MTEAQVDDPYNQTPDQRDREEQQEKQYRCLLTGKHNAMLTKASYYMFRDVPIPAQLCILLSTENSLHQSAFSWALINWNN